MKSKFILSSVILLMTITEAIAQGAKWEKDVPGKLIKAPPTKIPAFKTDALFEIINSIPQIANPKGFNVLEASAITSTKDKVISGWLSLRLYTYYSYEDGVVKLSNAHPPAINFEINNPTSLMNEQSIVLSEETTQLNLLKMFTDTFAIYYQLNNGYNLGHAVNTEYAGNKRLFVINPRMTPFFKPVTLEQYIRCVIVKLSTDIKKDEIGIEENKVSISEMERMPSLQASITEIKKAQNSFIKWVNFQKSKKLYYETKLTQLSQEQKNAPVYTAVYDDIASTMDRNGKHVENISGRLPYEPASIADTFLRKPVYTFINDPFDAKFPKSAFQLIVIRDGFRKDQKDEIIDFLDKEFYPNLSFKNIIALMYK